MKDVRFLLFVLLVLAVVPFIFGRFVVRYRQELIRTDTVTIVKIQEVHDTLPQIKTEKVIKYITLNGKTDTLLVKDSVHGDSLTLPVVQRVYTDDSSYTAYVSGARVDSFPRLDSIITRQRTLERIVTRTVYMKKGGFSVKVRPAVTAGYDPVRRSWGVMAGVAVVPDW